MDSALSSFNNAKRFEFIGQVLQEVDEYKRPEYRALAHKWAAEFGFSFNHLDPTKFNASKAFVAFNDSREAFERYIFSCDHRKRPRAPLLSKIDLKLLTW